MGWHCDDEPLFGECGEAKLIVSVSFGTSALFKWMGKSCSDGEAHLCCLGHGDILVMHGQCQDEFLHRTDPCREQERINVTFRWVQQHVSSCPLFKAGVVCCLPTCAQGSSVSVTVFFWVMAFWGLFGFSLVPCAHGQYQLGLFTFVCVQDSGYEGGEEVGGGIIFVTSGEIVGQHMKLPDSLVREEAIPSMGSRISQPLRDGPVSMVTMHVWFIGLKGHSAKTW